MYPGFCDSAKWLPAVAFATGKKTGTTRKAAAAIRAKPNDMSEETVEKKEKKGKRKWMRFVGNRYVLVSLFFIVWILFLDNYSRLNHRMLDKEIDELEENREYYKGEIKRDSQNIKLLKNPDQVEKYAREKYYMKRDSEDIYIIEYEGEKKDSSTYVPN